MKLPARLNFLSVIAILLCSNTVLAQCKDAVPGEYIVSYGNAVTQSGLSTKAAELARTEVRKELGALKLVSFKNFNAERIFIMSAVPDEGKIAALTKLNKINGIRPNCIRELRANGFTLSGKVELTNAPINSKGSLSLSGTTASELIQLNFDKSKQSYPIESALDIGKIAIGDGVFDNDGLPDMLVMGRSDVNGTIETNLYITQNLGSGHFQRPGDEIPFDNTGLVMEEVKSADLTNDQGDDLVISFTDPATNKSTIFIYYSNTDGTFTSKVLNLGGRITGLQIADFNEDKLLDLVTLEQTNTGAGNPDWVVSVYLSQGKAEFSTPQSLKPTYNAGNSVFGPSIADIGGDQYLDIVVVTPNRIEVFTNSGNGVFPTSPAVNQIDNLGAGGPATNFNSLTVVDLNRDNLADIGLSSIGTGVTDYAVQVRNQAGAFLSTNLTFTQVGSELVDTIATDFDNDRDYDLIYTDKTAGGPLVFMNKFKENGTAPGGALIFQQDKSYPTNITVAPLNSVGYSHYGVAGVTVTLTSKSNGETVTARTDTSGEFKFFGIPADNYSISAARQNYLITPKLGTDITINGNNDSLDFTAKPTVPLAPDLPADAPLTTTNDPGFGDMWGIYNFGQHGGTTNIDMDVTEAWELTKGTADTVIAIMDSGIDSSHIDLKDNLFVNTLEIAGNGIDDDNNGIIDDIHGMNAVLMNGDVTDLNSHGTHVAGTIGAIANNQEGIVGLNQNVKLMALNVFHDQRGASDASMLAAIDYAILMRNRGINIRAMNVSLGGPGSCPADFTNALNALNAAGIVFVAAAGNATNNNDTNPDFPSGCSNENLLSIAALDRNGNLANFSNFGQTTVDIGAPGVEILSTIPGNRYASFEGTSMAAPHASGAVALLSSFFPRLTPAELINRILRNPKFLGNLNGTMLVPGIISVRNALDDSVNIEPAEPLPPPLATSVPIPTATATAQPITGVGQSPQNPTISGVVISKKVNNIKKTVTFNIASADIVSASSAVSIVRVVATAANGKTREAILQPFFNNNSKFGGKVQAKFKSTGKSRKLTFLLTIEALNTNGQLGRFEQLITVRVK